MKCLLVNASSTARPRVVGQSMHPMTLLFLSSYARRHGHDARILDLSLCADPCAELQAHLAEETYPVVGFTAETENRFLVWDLILAARAACPEALLVAGGNHFTFTAREALAAIPALDVVVCLDGEETFLELLEAQAAGADLAGVNGLVTRAPDGTPVPTPPRDVGRDLDPFIIDESAYAHVLQPNAGASYTRFMTLRNFLQEEVKALPIHVGRGCPGRCVYCIYNRKRYRGRTADSVLAEIRHGIEAHGCHAFHLDDPYLAKRKPFIRDLCRTITAEKLDIQWYAELRADMDLELLGPMREAGCRSIDFGLESASPRVLESIHKQVTVEQASAFIHRCHALDIRVMAFSMVSLPDEREEDANLTMQFLEDHWEMLCASYLAVTKIYPGTDLDALGRERGILPADFCWYDRDFRDIELTDEDPVVPYWREHLSPEFIREFQERRLRLMYRGRPFLREAAGRLIPFLTDWSELGCQRRREWLGTARKYLLDWPLLELRRRWRR